MDWIVLSLATAAVWAVVNIIDKQVLTHWVKDVRAPLIVLGLVGLLAGIGILLVRGFPSSWSLYDAVLLLIAGVTFAGGVILYFRAMSLDEASRIIGLYYVAPLWVLILGAWFLGEVFTPLKYAGVISIVAGALLLSVRSVRSMRNGQVLVIMLLETMLFAISAVANKLVLVDMDAWSVFAISRIISFFVLVPVMVGSFASLVSSVASKGWRVVGAMTVSETLTALGGVLITFALVSGPATLVNALASMQPVFVLALMALLTVARPKLFKEEISRSALVVKACAIALIVSGAVLVS
ncbi:MAG: DMT family transporter [Nanoarchaeota archaeon]